MFYCYSSHFVLQKQHFVLEGLSFWRILVELRKKAGVENESFSRSIYRKSRKGNAPQ